MLTLHIQLSCEGITVTSSQLHYPKSDIALRILFGKHRVCAGFVKIHLPLLHEILMMSDQLLQHCRRLKQAGGSASAPSPVPQDRPRLSCRK